MANGSNDDELTAQENLSWNVACDGYARLLELYRSEDLPERDMLLVASFIVASLHKGNLDELVHMVRHVAHQILEENLTVTVSRPDKHTVIVDTKSRNENN